MRGWVVAGVALMAVVCASGFAHGDFARTLTGQAAFGDWRIDAPGLRFRITPADLPPPNATPSTANPPIETSRPDGVLPKAPFGFAVDVIAQGLNQPRVMRTAPNGDIFLAESGTGRVMVIRGADAADTPVETGVFADKLDRPYGIAFYPPGPEPKFVYVATPGEVYRFPYKSGDLVASGKSEKIVGLPDGGGHWTRDLAVAADGATIYASVGSTSNDAEEMKPLAGLEAFRKTHALGAAWGPEAGRADVLAFKPDGSAMRVLATGLRNCSGLGVQPQNGALWCVVNERDTLGDDLPPDFATTVGDGKFYGWPWYYIGDREDPLRGKERPDLKGQVTTPDVLLQPHSAPLGIAFYNSSHFPAKFRDGAFVAMHGSWNRAKRTGYKVVRLVFDNGRPTGEYEDFLVGFVDEHDRVWGRPSGVAVTKGGDLLVSDDLGGVIWRVRYLGG
ncbi:MAG: PQQ-dependent sugar dehydrogenase [Pseudomonadota bacterium]|nr:PQQ-dependent sugar dehydrogenase [Pseudomonadota bacterium]